MTIQLKSAKQGENCRASYATVTCLAPESRGKTAKNDHYIEIVYDFHKPIR